MSKSRPSQNSSSVGWGAGACVVAVLVILGWYLMSGYGEISNNAYQYARSLYTVCNQRDSQRLEKIVAMIEADLQAQKISNRDHQYLMGLVQKAKAGEWDDAQESIRQLLEAQVKAASG
jgi:hypothetical protein